MGIVRPTAEWIHATATAGVLNMEDTWVSPQYRYFYMGVPKAASSKVKMVLQELEGNPLPPNPFGVHARTAEGITFVPRLSDFKPDEALEILTSPTWFRFTFVRNPYSRLVSAYRQKVMNLNTPWVGFREAIRAAAGHPTPSGAPPRMVAFQDFVRYVRQQPDAQRDGHWRSQAGILCIDAIDYDFIGKQETFAADFTRVLDRFGAAEDVKTLVSEVVGASLAVHDAAAYDPECAALVYEMYREDFETFSYEKDGWRRQT